MITHPDIHLGFWTNWSQGKVLGATITLSPTNGAFLIAFLALFVAWSGSQLWELFSYIVFQIGVSDKPRDAFHHQKLVLLRMGMSNVRFFWSLLSLSWAWRSQSRHAMRRSTPLLALALIHAVCLALAGIFSSRVTAAGDEALIKSTVCGLPSFEPLRQDNVSDAELDRVSGFLVMGTQLLDDSRMYSRACYLSSVVADTDPCHSYVSRNLSPKSSLHDECMFEEGTCSSPTIMMDTGIIDSHVHLGINAPVQDRIAFRKVMNCSIIPAEEKFSSDWMTSGQISLFFPSPVDPSIIPGPNYKFFNLGPNKIGPMPRPFTFFVANMSSPKVSYDMLAFAAVDRGMNNIDIIPQLRKDDAEVVVWALFNRVAFTGPVDDPWFKSTREEPYLGGVGKVWRPDHAASVAGCAEQYQFCNKSACTTLSGIGSLADKTASLLKYNLTQTETMKLLITVLTTLRLDALSVMLQDRILLAKDRLFGTYFLSTPHPANQWELELENANNISLSALQSIILLHANPPNLPITLNTSLHRYILNETTPEALRLCANQKIRTSAYYSFNVLGLSLVLIGGIIVIILSKSVPTIAASARRRNVNRSNLSLTRESVWITNNPVDLLMVALTTSGILPPGRELDLKVPEKPDQEFRLPWVDQKLQNVALDMRWQNGIELAI